MKNVAFILARAAFYATLFIGFLLVFLPSRIVAGVGFTPVTTWGAAQVVGAIVTAAGALLAVSCILTFVFVGRGTPAPFDPPRRLVVRGPYRFVRNPMYIGAGSALFGAALYYESWALAAYAAAFLLLMHMFVVLGEEPVLRATFGEQYDDYCGRVRRWLPRPHRPSTR